MSAAPTNPFRVLDVRLVVFDLDGTLLDSLDDIAESVNSIRTDWNLPPLAGEQVMAGIGRGARHLVAQTIPEPIASGVIDLEALYAHFHAVYKRRSLERPRLYPGAREFLAALAPHCTLAVLTNKPREITEPLLERIAIARSFARVVTPENARGRKPDPGGLVDLLRDLCIAPRQSLLVGDSINDFAAGRGAGVFSIGMRCGYYQPGEPDPDLWVDDFAGLLELWNDARRAKEIASGIAKP